MTGLTVKDQQGRVVLSVADRITRMLGSVDTGGTSGRVNDTRIAIGTGWFHVVMDSVVNSQYVAPTVALDSNGLAWTYTLGRSQKAQPVRIIYGAF